MPYITINLDTMEYRHSVGIPSEISTNEFYFEISEKEIEKVNNKIKKLKWDSSRCLNFLLKCFYSRLDSIYRVVHFYSDRLGIHWDDDLGDDKDNKKIPYRFKRLKMAKRRLEEVDEYKEMFCLGKHVFLIIPEAFQFQFNQMVKHNFPEFEECSNIDDLPPNYIESFFETIKKRNDQIVNLLINL